MFAKASDTVCHPKLLLKIKSNMEWPSNRNLLYVYIAECLSKMFPVVSGVSQGSVVGSLFCFWFMISQMLFPTLFMQIKMFLDDSKIYYIQMITVLQFTECISLFSLWSDIWQLSVESQKYVSSSFGN